VALVDVQQRLTVAQVLLFKTRHFVPPGISKRWPPLLLLLAGVAALGGGSNDAPG
jgi:hypothetical protein